MPVENTDSLRWSNAKFPKDPFRLLLCLRFNARVDNCSFHSIIVSLSQHRCKVFFLTSIFSSFVQRLLYITASHRKEVSENQGSSLLNNPPEAEQFCISLHCKKTFGPSSERIYRRTGLRSYLPKSACGGSIRTRDPGFDFFRSTSKNP